MAMKLRDLIRKVRACKTAAEERSVIAKESAMIRTAIREEQAHFRHRNVAKLLFMHMLGYPTHFGQLECMKLVASPHFPEKRIGYLGMMLLLSEEADVLMLATNALKNDLASDNRFIAGLALCCIGNLATADMSRDLVPEVDKHLKSPLAYLRKKACLAMVRCLAKCPDMVEDFVDRLATLLQDKSHGVLITVVQLMTQVLMIDYRNAQEEGVDPFETNCRTAFLALVPILVKLLRNLLGGGFSSDYDVGGIADPFLQVQILTLLRLLGVHNVEASEEMNDVLAQVASNTDSAKNAGNAILYECVQTIMGTESEEGLRVLAVNILGRFLLNRDNNIRYVALNTLSRCIIEQKQFGRDDDSNSAMSALQRHRQTVVDCLRDPDISIRQRALELIYHLVNESNVESLTGELLGYLVLCPREHRSDICTRILKVVNRFGPDDRWKVDTLITTLTIAGREASTDVQNAAVIYISRASPDIHAFATHKLLKAIRDSDGCQIGLLTVGVWCVGEYGDLLLKPYSYKATEESSAAISSDGISVTFMALDTTMVIDALEKVTQKHSCPEVVKERALTAYVKLTNRFSFDPAATNRLQSLIEKNRSSRSLEIQVRSCEYKTLLNAAKGLAPQVVSSPTDDIFGVGNDTTNGGRVSDAVVAAAKDALARMPVVNIKLLHKRLTSQDGHGEGDSTPRAPRPKASIQNGGGGGDLLDIFGGGDAAPVQNGIGSGVAKSDLDLLSDIFSASTNAAPAGASGGGYYPFGGSSTTATLNPVDLFAAPPAAALPTANMSASVASMDLFGGGSTKATAPVQSQAPVHDIFGAPAVQVSAAARVKAFSHAGLDVEFECTKPDSTNMQKSVLVAHMKNTTSATMNGVNLQVAVPKYIKMEIEPPTSTTIPPSGGKPVTQKITVINSMMGTKNLVLKVKIGFTANGQKIDHLATCSGFPPGQY